MEMVVTNRPIISLKVNSPTSQFPFELILIVLLFKSTLTFTLTKFSLTDLITVPPRRKTDFYFASYF